MVINRPLLGVIETGKKTHWLMVCELSEGLGADATHKGIAKRYPDITCGMSAFSKVNSTKAAVSMNNKQLNPTTNRTQDRGQGWERRADATYNCFGQTVDQFEASPQSQEPNRDVGMRRSPQSSAAA